MNVIFTAVFISSMVALLICAPQDFLPALISGGENAVKTAVMLFTVYAVWMGFSKLCERSGLSRGVARALRPAAKKIFNEHFLQPFGAWRRGYALCRKSNRRT